MQIVIEISDTLKDIADNEDTKTFSHIIWQALLMDAIKNGQPLPKGHGKLIDARAFSGEMFCEADLTDAHTCYDSIQRLLEKEPTVIEADGGVE